MKKLRNETDVATAVRHNVRMTKATERQIEKIKGRHAHMIGREPTTTCVIRRAIEVYETSLEQLVSPDAIANELSGLLRGALMA